MALTTGLIVFALVVAEVASVLYLGHYVRARRKRHDSRFPTSHFSTTPSRRLL
jgi:O-antigen/teichoic acid export membrane protein